MNTSPKPLILTAVIAACLALAVTGILYVMEVGTSTQLQDGLIKSLLIIVIVLAVSLVIWRVARSRS